MMKKLIGYFAVTLLGFAAGGVVGWVARKKLTEVPFEVMDIQEAPPENTPEKPPIPEENIETKIGKVFSTQGTDTVDTQKAQYFKQWKAEEALERYNTVTREDPVDPVVSEDLEEGFDQDFMKDIAEAEKPSKTRPDIEPATMEDWNHWMNEQDGEYDCEVVYWFEGDNVIVDERGDPIDNPGKYFGFDVIRRFNEISEETTGDPNVRIIYNHRPKVKTIFQIAKRRGTYNRKSRMEVYGGDYDGDDLDE